MSARKTLVLGGITIDPAKPTTIPLERLFAWVVWQFPRVGEKGYCGAVHPPEIGHGWYPAFIDNQEASVHIFGHVKEPFPSPEAAVRHLDRVTFR